MSQDPSLLGANSPEFVLHLTTADLTTIVKTAVNEALTSHNNKIELPPPPPELYTRDEARAKLGVTIPTMIAWGKNGLLPPVRLGRLVRYRRLDVETLMGGNKLKARGQA